MSDFIVSMPLIYIDTLEQTNIPSKKKKKEMLYDFYFRAVEDFVLNIPHCTLMRIHRKNII